MSQNSALQLFSLQGRLSYFLALCLLCGACAHSDRPSPSLPKLINDPSGGFFDSPFPDNDRLTDAGAIRFRGLPNPGRVGFVKASIESSETLNGPDPNGAVYFRFDRALLPDALHATLDQPRLNTVSFPGVHFVNVDDNSPFFGEKIPVWVRMTQVADSVRPAHLLQVLPVPGIRVRENTLYAVAIETDLEGRGKNVFAQSESAAREALAPMQALKKLGLAEKPFAAFTTFRTGAPTKFLFDQAAIAQQSSPPVVRNLRLERTYADYSVVMGEVEIPIYQSGKPPHLFGKGAIQQNKKGELHIFRTEWAPFTLSVPHQKMPKAGYAQYLYLHGTGGRATQPIDRGYRETPNAIPQKGLGFSSWVAPLGYATACMAGAYSPDRIGIRALDGYGAYAYMNPVAMRDNFAQMVLEQIIFMRLLDTLEIDASLFKTNFSESQKIHFRQSERLVGGQSLGSYLAGMLASVTGAFDAAILTGAGGSWIEFGFGPKDPVDLKALLNFMTLKSGEELDRHHPYMTLFQNAVGPADNTHFTPFLLDERPGKKTPHILVIQGQRDKQIAVNLQRALQLSIRTDLVGFDVGRSATERITPILSLAGLRVAPSPLSGNRTAFGKARTAATLRYQEDGKLDGHYVVFQRDDAKRAFINFARDVIEKRVPSVSR